MRRREFISFVGSAAVAWPLAARAQQSALPVIGFLNPASPATYADPLAAFRQGVGETGYVEHQNVAIEYRWAGENYERLPALAADLVNRHVAVIAATGGDVSVLAAKAVSATIPIVFDTSSDPVKVGLVASLNRPGGNLTGVSILTVDLTRKRLELLCEVVPNAALIGFLVNPNRPSAAAETNSVQTVAKMLGRQIAVLTASSEPEIDAAFATLVQLKAHALVVGPDNFFNSRREQIVALAARHAIPAIYARRQFVMAGGLMSYDASLVEAYRLVGVYTGKILKGENPAELPVQQQTKIELTINLKTAKALALTMPLPVLGRADEVIE
jgi:putative tryptophan/tyrosine transport system substrate-binding protein